MATANIVLPPAGKIYLVCIWIDTLLYGISCVVYGLCMFVILRERSTITNRWVLVLTSTVLFLLATVHVASALERLLEAYVYAPPGVPGYADTYFLQPNTPIHDLQNTIFIPLMTVQDLVLIWRLYVVFNGDWRTIAFPILLEAISFATTIACAVLLSIGDFDVARVVSLVSASLNLAVNVVITIMIAVRLWWMGRIVSSLCKGFSRSHPFASSIWVIIESGAIFIGVLAVSLAFYITEIADNSLALAWVGITCQFAVITPLLVVVRVGLGFTHSLPRAYQNVILSQLPVDNEIGLRPDEVEHRMEFHARSSSLERETCPDDPNV